MNTFNPFQFFSTSFPKEQMNEQQLKAQEFIQAVNSETQKQLAKAPQRIQETINVAQQNFASLQDTIQQSSTNFQNPQSVVQLWSKHFQDTYQRNVSLLQKHHEENVQSFSEIKSHFEKTGEKMKTETEQNIKKFQEKATEALTDVQKNVQKSFENVQSEIKDNIDTLQSQAVKNFNDVVEKTSSLNTQIQDQVSKGISTLTSAVEASNAAAQEVVKSTTKKGGKN